MDIKEILNNSKNLAISTVFQGSSLSSKRSSPQKKEQSSKSKDKQIKDLFISPPRNQKVLSSPESKTKSPESSADSKKQRQLHEIRDEFQEKPKKQENMMYKIDDKSYLMDENGNYILNESGQMIKLNEEHLNILRESVLIKFE